MTVLAVFAGLLACFGAGYWLRGWIDRKHDFGRLTLGDVMDGLKEHDAEMRRRQGE